jgi:tetratricopeptide (TPR) repeat protein
MNLLRTLLVGFAVFISNPGWCQDGQSSDIDQDRKLAPILTETEGIRLLKSGKQNEAIDLFDKIIANYEERYKDDKTQFFCSRSPTESLLYLTEFSITKTSTTKVKAKVVSSDWAYAYYLRAYALLEIGRPADAKLSLERALALSPRNSQFLSELANIYQREKNWPLALQTFQLAEAAAKDVSPPNLKNSDLSRAWRGIGFVYVEQNRLDEAEKIYQQCLELDKNDAKALNELRYIQGMKAKEGAR